MNEAEMARLFQLHREAEAQSRDYDTRDVEGIDTGGSRSTRVRSPRRRQVVCSPIVSAALPSLVDGGAVRGSRRQPPAPWGAARTESRVTERDGHVPVWALEMSRTPRTARADPRRPPARRSG